MLIFRIIARCRFFIFFLAIIFSAGAPNAATIVVNSISDALTAGTGLCSLRGAIDAMNGGADANGCVATGTYGVGDTVQFSEIVAGQTIQFTAVNGGGIAINNNGLTIKGPTSAASDRARRVTLKGGGSGSDFRLLSFLSSGYQLTVQDLNFLDGNLTSGGQGGAIISSSNVAVSRCNFTNNISTSYGGAIEAIANSIIVDTSEFFSNSTGNAGGAIDTSGRVEITNSTFYNNKSVGAYGGGAVYAIDLTVVNSTFVNNTAHNGGAAYVESSLLVRNVTAVNNNVTGSGATFFGRTPFTANIANSLIVGASALPHCAGGANFSGGSYNLEARDSGGGLVSATSCGSSNAVTIPSGTPVGSIVSTTLAANGGLTQTLALPAGSPALDKASAALSASEDQRGFYRPVNVLPDVGAVEKETVALSPVTLSAGTLSVVYPAVTFNAAGASNYTINAANAPIQTIGGLPPGMTFTVSGTLAGTPMAAGVYSFIVEARNAANNIIAAERYWLAIMDVQPIAVSLNWNPGTVSDGTLPQVEMGCSNMGVIGTSSPWFAYPGDTCGLTVTVAAAPPTGYSLATPNYSLFDGVTLLPSLALTAPSTGASLTLTTNLTADPQSIIASSVFSPAVSGGTSPTVTLSCVPAATVVTAGASWTAPTGASCTVSASGGSAPTGYTAGTTTFTVDGVLGPSFTVPSSGITAIVATTPLNGANQPVTIVGNTFNPSITGGTLPTIGLNCGAATVSGSYPNFQVPTGAICTVTTSGAVAPTGYTPGAVTFGGTGINAVSGAFTVPVGGVADITVTTALTGQPQTVTISKTVAGATAGYAAGTKFTVQINCGAGGSKVMQLADGESNTFTPPTGASCTVSEVTPVNPPGYAYSAPLISPATFTVQAGGQSVSVTNTLAALNQPITLTKSISGDLAGYTVGDTFEITLTCAQAGTQAFNLAKDQNGSFTAPTGDTCTVTETAPVNPPGYAYAAPAIIPASFTVPAGGQIVSIANTVQAQNQTVTVTKTVTGDTSGYPSGSTFTITINCSSSGSKVLQLANGASGTFNPLTGETCEVTEAMPPNPPGYAYSAPVVSPTGTFTVATGDNPVSVTNTLTAQSQTITLAKIVSGDIAGYPAGSTFALNLVCSDGTDVSLNLEDEEVDSTVSVPTGAMCTVTESTPSDPAGYTYDNIVISPPGFTVPAGGKTVTVTNSLSAQNQLVTVTKTVTGDTAGYPAGNQFDITIDCSVSGSQTLSLADGASGTFDPLTGETCTVTESTPVDPPGYAYGVPAISPTSFTVAPGNNGVSVSNSLTAQPQTLTVRKIVNGDTAGYVSGSTFDISVTCTPPSGSPVTVPLSLADGASDTSIQAVTGASCVVTENIPAGTAQPGYHWETPVISPASFTMPAGGQTVTVTNAITAENQTVTITKTLGGDTWGYPAGSTFPIEINCSSSGSRTLNLASGASGTFNPATGETCTVTETLTTANDPAGYAYVKIPLITPAGPFTVAAGSNNVSVSNILNAGGQTITVQKEVTGATAGYVAGKTFALHLTCTPPSGLSLTKIISLADGGSDNSANAVPTGSLCSVTETIPADTVLAGYAWDTPAINPATFTVADGGQTVTVTNHLIASGQPVTVTKTVSGDGKATGYVAGTKFSIVLTCAGTPEILQLADGESQTVTVPTAASCSVTETAPANPSGYSYGTPAIAPASFTVPAGGQAVSVANILTAQSQNITIISNGFTPSAGGTLPTVGLNCGAATVGGAYPNFTVPTGASCTLTTASAVAPAGYTLGSVIFGGTGVNASTGAFIVPVGGIADITVNTALTAQPQTVSVSAAYTGAAGGATGTLVTALSCVGVTPTPAGNDRWMVPTGTSCTASASGAAVNAGYTLGAASYTGTSGASSGVFTVAGTGNTIVISLPVTANTQSVTYNAAGSGFFHDATSVPGGTLPGISLTCTPAASGSSPFWGSQTGAACTLSLNTGAEAAPAGYTVNGVTYVLNGTDLPGNNFIVGNGANVITIKRLLAQNQTITATSVFDPAISGGTEPVVALSCAPGGATLVTSGTTWAAPAGDVCTVSASGGTAPSGYMMGATAFTIDGVAGTMFTVPASGVTVIAATTPLTGDTSLASTLATTLDVPFDPAVSGGSNPKLAVTCVPAAIQGTLANTWTVAQGASCTLSVSGGTPPAGYTFDGAVYSGTGVNPTTGAFTVPAGGIADLSAKMMLKAAIATPIPVVNGWLIGFLLLMLGGTGLLMYRRTAC